MATWESVLSERPIASAHVQRLFRLTLLSLGNANDKRATVLTRLLTGMQCSGVVLPANRGGTGG